MSVQTIITRVQVMYEDPTGDQGIDSDYVQGFIAIHNEDIESELAALDLSYDTAVIVIPAVPAGTTDLSAYQADGQPLGNMMLPTALEWRQVGQDDTRWTPVPRLDKVLDEATSGPGTPSTIIGIQSAEWRGGILYISPSSVDVDVRVRCEELPAVLDTNSATYIKGLANVLVWGVCGLIAHARGGPGAEKKVAYYTKKHDDALDNVECRMVKAEQVVSRRMGGRRSTIFYPAWRPPNSGAIR